MSVRVLKVRAAEVGQGRGAQETPPAAPRSRRRALGLTVGAAST